MPEKLVQSFSFYGGTHSPNTQKRGSDGGDSHMPRLGESEGERSLCISPCIDNSLSPDFSYCIMDNAFSTDTVRIKFKSGGNMWAIYEYIIEN